MRDASYSKICAGSALLRCYISVTPAKTAAALNWDAEDSMTQIQARFIGVELYCDNLETAKKFYVETMGLEVSDEQIGHHTKFNSGPCFVCIERKGAESYPSKDKAVLFFEVPDLKLAIAAIGQDRLVQSEGTWAVLHDPEGHNILLLQRSN